MVGALLLIGIIALWAMFHFLRAKKKTPSVTSAVLKEGIRCPSCATSLQMEEMLDAAVFFGPGAIVFDCGHCHDRVYFAPYENHIETGTLGCSPVVDPIPHENFSYPRDFNMASNIRDGILKIQIKERSWAIPRYGLEIPGPNPAVKRDAPTSGAPLTSSR